MYKDATMIISVRFLHIPVPAPDFEILLISVVICILKKIYLQKYNEFTFSFLRAKSPSPCSSQIVFKKK